MNFKNLKVNYCIIYIRVIIHVLKLHTSLSWFQCFESFNNFDKWSTLYVNSYSMKIVNKLSKHSCNILLPNIIFTMLNFGYYLLNIKYWLIVLSILKDTFFFNSGDYSFLHIIVWCCCKYFYINFYIFSKILVNFL